MKTKLNFKKGIPRPKASITDSGWQNIPEDNFKQPLNDIEVFKKIIEASPYPISVFSSDGIVIFGNEAGIKLFQTKPGDIFGKWNLFKDPTINAVMPFEKIKQVYKGETVFFPMVKVPLKELAIRNDADYEMEGLYNDITYFPVMEGGSCKFIIQHHVPSRVYYGKLEIEKAKEYLENNWFEKFILKDVLAVSGLSKTHFTRLFKQYTGTTAHEYYINIKSTS